MKIRTGFVSNSSSCSFQVWGTAWSKWGFKEEGFSSYNEFCDKLKDVVDKLGTDVEINFGQDAEMVYLGHDIYNMGEDETKAQFYDRTVEEINKVLKMCELAPVEKKDCHWHEESWYDG